jgi:hypothetical protein
MRYPDQRFINFFCSYCIIIFDRNYIVNFICFTSDESTGMDGVIDVLEERLKKCLDTGSYV